MAEWIGQVRGVLRAVFDVYAIRIAVFLIAWPVFHQVLELPAFDVLSVLNIPVVNDYFVHVRSLLSFGLALFVQRWIHNGQEWLKTRAKRRRLIRIKIGDTEPREAALIWALFRERCEPFTSTGLAKSEVFGPVIQALFPNNDDYLRALRRLSSTNYLLHVKDDRYAPPRTGYVTEHQAIKYHVEELKSHAGNYYRIAERKLDQRD